MQTGTIPDRRSGMEQGSDGSAPTTGTCRTAVRRDGSIAITDALDTVAA
ncbi:hypothetical protein [Halorubrum sp. DTA98]